jgi:hypothetical protein
MRQEPSLLIGPMDLPPHPITRSGSCCHQLPELIARLLQLARRLQHFQQRYWTQLSRTDQAWLYHTQQRVAFDLARLSNLDDMGGVAPEASEPSESLQELEPTEQLVRQITSLVQNTTQMIQTVLLPHQKAAKQGLDVTSGRSPHSASSSDGATADAILIVLGKHNQLASHEEATDGVANGPSIGPHQPLADRGADTTDVHLHHYLQDSSLPFLPQHEASVGPHHADRNIPVRRYHEMKLDEQIEILGRLRCRLEGSSRKSHRTSRAEP